MTFAACGGGRTQDVRASAPIADPRPATTATTASTATTAPATTTVPDEPASSADASRSSPAPSPAHATHAPAPAQDSGPAAEPETTAPAPASITVTYHPHDGATATASIEETGQSASLADGAAVFDGLADGTYVVDVTVTYPDETSGDTSIGAETITRSRPIAVHAGDHAVVSCDDQGCVGIA